MTPPLAYMSGGVMAMHERRIMYAKPETLIGDEINVVWWRNHPSYLEFRYRVGFEPVTHESVAISFHLRKALTRRVPFRAIIHRHRCNYPDCLTADVRDR